MNPYELNKIAGAFLFAGVCLMALNITAGAIFSPAFPERPGYEVAVKGEEPKQPAGGAPAAAQPIGELLASASVDKGENAAKKCAACHTFDKGGPNKVGPNLWGIIGRTRASQAGFGYSAALKADQTPWTFEEINAFITNPKADVPGTSMAFAGVAKASERADIIAFLNKMSDAPKPLTGSSADAAK